MKSSRKKGGSGRSGAKAPESVAAAEVKTPVAGAANSKKRDGKALQRGGASESDRPVATTQVAARIDDGAAAAAPRRAADGGAAQQKRPAQSSPTAAKEIAQTPVASVSAPPVKKTPVEVVDRAARSESDRKTAAPVQAPSRHTEAAIAPAHKQAEGAAVLRTKSAPPAPVSQASERQPESETVDEWAWLTEPLKGLHHRMSKPLFDRKLVFSALSGRNPARFAAKRDKTGS
jgi:hypothetical protein